MHNCGSPITTSIMNGPTCETFEIVHEAGGSQLPPISLKGMNLSRRSQIFSHDDIYVESYLFLGGRIPMRIKPAGGSILQKG